MMRRLVLAASLSGILVLGLEQKARAQVEIDERPMRFNGMEFRSADSLFYINFRFRMQNRAGFISRSGTDLRVREYDARVRRLRLRADGYVLREKLGYSLQLSFSRGDQDFEASGVANIVRDAVIFYNITPNFYVAFGLNKLPGNRQRVTSSGQLQFAERSIVNSALTIDRDFGIKLYYTHPLGPVALYSLKGAITTGEGRSPNGTGPSLAYTGRAELLPLGAFQDGGDYSEGDLAREPTPKVSVAAGYSFNRNTTRSGGQLGLGLYSPVDLGTFIADAMVKYRGWAYLGEYLERHSPDPFTFGPADELRYAFVGRGFNQQLSYYFPSRWEPALRYSWLRPDQVLSEHFNQQEVLEVGLTRYLRKHRVKAQVSASYQPARGNWDLDASGNRWGGVFQFELGI
ncbi:phosphate-selective porin O and P [Hymenobacter roseosalivarius DSM 11622]|uniref:Phosphate-selective porin O and P n=1 Tax=Hymenobacter roseosalivarius DSM 11622 TaxID=645990 RepID=A0A1W1W0E1_9BACT|nr:porin [Hymenobacter roseosalivarius]SMB99087.1 phosphate-selective porin O and P [Hymenobacter roseosalivarius DSM 11622]